MTIAIKTCRYPVSSPCLVFALEASHHLFFLSARHCLYLSFLFWTCVVLICSLFLLMLLPLPSLLCLRHSLHIRETQGCGLMPWISAAMHRSYASPAWSEDARWLMEGGNDQNGGHGRVAREPNQNQKPEPFLREPCRRELEGVSQRG